MFDRTRRVSVHQLNARGSVVDGYLRAGKHGILGLADDDDAYAVPLSDYYDGEQSLLRVSGYGGDSEKELSMRPRSSHSCATRPRRRIRTAFRFTARSGSVGET